MPRARRTIPAGPSTSRPTSISRATRTISRRSAAGSGSRSSPRRSSSGGGMGTDYTRAELCIAAAAEAWRDDGEVLASGITVIPRLAASLACLTFNPDLLMTDGECMLVAEPVPVGPRGSYQPKIEAWMPYRASFELLWGGKRHIMGAPTQIDRWGATNISCIGGDHQKPKSQLLGARGFPGNSVHHAQSLWA